VRGILDELPETLDETYEQVLKNINKVNRKHAIRLLHSLTVAIRPLRVEELAEVLAVDFDAAQQGGIPKLNPNWRWTDHHQAVLSTCSSLIAIVDDGGHQVVQFSHFSVKEYLTSDRLANASGTISRYYILPESAHTILAQACLGVLLRLDDHVNEDDARDIPLANYAAEHWVDHAQVKDVSSRIQDAMEAVFDVDKLHYATWLRLHDMDIDFGFADDSDRPRHGKPLYSASLCGFHDLAKHLAVKHPEQVNARGGRIGSPLGAALFREHFQVAELLLEYGADINAQIFEGSMLLHLASAFGLVNIVRWLPNHGADANAQPDNGWTPLHLAVGNGYPEVARMLLEHNANVKARGEIPLHLAVVFPELRDRIDILQLLLDHGADVKARDNEGSTPLHHSAFRKKDDWSFSGKGSVEVTRLLLERGASVDAENNERDTPFQVALKWGHYEMVEFLWGLGTD